MFVIKSRHRGRDIKERLIDGKRNWHRRDSESTHVITLHI